MSARDALCYCPTIIPGHHCKRHKCRIGLDIPVTPLNFPQQWVIVVAEYPERECCRNEGQGCGTLSHPTLVVCCPHQELWRPLTGTSCPSEPQTACLSLPPSQSSCPTSPKARSCKDSLSVSVSTRIDELPWLRLNNLDNLWIGDLTKLPSFSVQSICISHLRIEQNVKLQCLLPPICSWSMCLVKVYNKQGNGHNASPV